MGIVVLTMSSEPRRFLKNWISRSCCSACARVLERPKGLPFTSFGVNLARIHAICAGRELANHRLLSLQGYCPRPTGTFASDPFNPALLPHVVGAESSELFFRSYGNMIEISLISGTRFCAFMSFGLT